MRDFQIAFQQPGDFIYAREGHPLCSQAEQKLSQLEDSHAVLFDSGLSAIWAVLMHRKPKTIAHHVGYHGTMQSIELYCQITGAIHTKYDGSKSDLLLIESPMNPSGELFTKQIPDGQVVAVDITMAPVPLQNPFSQLKATYAITSLTKFHSGHGDILAGMVSVKSVQIKDELIEQRSITGTILHGYDCMVLLRSLETFQLRLSKQVENAQELKAFLKKSPKVENVLNEIGAVLHVVFDNEATVQDLLDNPPFIVKTSFGSTQTTMECRAQYGGSKQEIRFSIGVEDVQLLKTAFTQTALFTSKNRVKYQI